MRKAINYMLPVLLLVLGYLVYMQWFSPSKPLLFVTPEKTTFPSNLSSLPIKSLDGKKDTLNISNDALTIFVVENPRNVSLAFYNTLKPFHEWLTKQGIQIVYLWNGPRKDERLEIIKIVDADSFATHVDFDQRLHAQYQQMGLQFVRFPLVFVYSQEGEAIYSQHPILPDTLSDLMSLFRDKGNEHGRS